MENGKMYLSSRYLRNDNMEKRLEQIFNKTFAELPPQKENWNVLQIENWDSLMHMNLMSTIEMEFSVKIPLEDYLKCTSFDKTLNEIKMIKDGTLI